MGCDYIMQQVIMETSALQLPKVFAEKIGTDHVMVRVVNEGILVTPLPNRTRRLRGMLKGTGFSTERYFERKRADKELEA